MKITFYVGLPGSGKTYLGSKQAAEQRLNFLDDVKDFSKVEAAVRTGQDLVVADPYLCREDVRTRAVEKIKALNSSVEIEWIFFENNLDKCRRNVAYRNDGRYVEPTIKFLSAVYKIPEGVKPIVIWEPPDADS